MRTFDIFDTIIGRWYKEPDSIFREIEHDYGIDNFTWWRKHTERLSQLKTFDDIYNQEWPKEFDKEYLKNLEFELELKRTFPIKENVEKIKDCVLISDTYFTKDQLVQLLNNCGISGYKDINCGYALKSSGIIWRHLSGKIESHTGDNKESDYSIPTSYKINCTHYTGSEFTSNESWADTHGYPYLARLMRMTRLTGSGPINLEQSNVNLPILVLFSNYLKDVNKVLFTLRDCDYLQKVHSARFGQQKAFISSRVLYTYPTKSYITYCKKQYKDEPLIVDLQGTGKSCIEFFTKNLKKKPNYLTLINSDLNNEHDIKYLYHRNQGLSDYVERVNYVPYGRYEEFGKTPQPLLVPEIKEISDFWSRNLPYFSDFKLEKESNMALLWDFLNYLEHNCYIKTVVNHEEI